MHLSTTYRKEHISGWLGWVPGVHLLGEKERFEFYRIFLRLLTGRLDGNQDYRGGEKIDADVLKAILDGLGQIDQVEVKLEVQLPASYKNDE